MSLGEDEVFTCYDCKQMFSGKEMRVVLITPSTERYVCGNCASKYDTFRCRLISINYLCPKCGEIHEFDLGRLLLLEITNGEKYDSFGMASLSCGRYSTEIKGKIKLIIKK